MDKKTTLPKFKENYNYKRKISEQYSNPDGLVSESTTTATINTINPSNNYFYSIYNKMPKNNMLSIPHPKNNPNINVFSRGVLKKEIGNATNNIIINNNTNIINNNNTNIINNNIININNKNEEREYNRSMSQTNISKINSFKNNIKGNNNNSTRGKHLIFNKKKIYQKNHINISNNIMNKNKKKDNHLPSYNSLDAFNNFNNNNNNNNYSNNYNINDYNSKNYTNEDNNAILNVEEILMIEEKLSSLINCLINGNPCTEESFEYINFYFTTKLSKNINKYFIKETYLQIIKMAINLKLFSFIICYDISLNENIFSQYIIILKEMFSCVHNILILISKYFCNKIIEENSNIWVKKLKNLIQKYDPMIKPQNKIFEEIDILCKKLTDNLFPLLLKKYNNHVIIDIYNKINFLSQYELHKIYMEKIFVNMNLNGSVVGSASYFQKNKNDLNGSVPVPYLKNIPNKKYTLVLDLDETLIHFKGHPNDESSGVLLFRPFLSEFLSNICNFYELVVFTAATQDYADPIINAIEQKGTKFDHRLYRKHTIVINDEFIKDLNRLGRDLSRIIIVDNMEQNYKLQPDNGITIRPFWGKDVKDMALFDLLSILIKIVENNMDVREGISWFKEDIISRVTSNIFRRVQY